MKSLTFYEQQHLQKLLQQQGSVKYLFDDFVRQAGPLLARWSDHNKASVWVGNQTVENSIERLLSDLHSGLLANITDNMVQSWNRGNKKADDLVSSFIKDLSVSDTLRDKMFSRNAEALNVMLNRKDEYGLTVSDRVWNLANGAKDNLGYYLASGLSAGRPSALISQDVRQLLHQPDKRFHRVRDKNGNLVSSQPMKDYHPGQGVYRSAYKNALRLSSTQTNKAFRSADYERWKNMDFVLGIEVERSPSHKGPCPICDALAGRYSKEYKFTGHHPFCICIATPIMMDHEDFADYLLDDTIKQDKIITRMPDGEIVPHEGEGSSFDDLIRRANSLGIKTKRFEDSVAKNEKYAPMISQALEIEIKKAENNATSRKKLYDSVEKKENEIRMNAKYESSVGFDADGNVILDKRGRSRSVRFTSEECKMLKDAVVTHNHPGGWAYPENSIMRIGNSFSPEDITFSVGNDLSEFRAVTPNYTFVLKRPTIGWGASLSEVNKSIKELNRSITKENKQLIKKGTITPEQAAVTHWHRLNKELSQKYGWIYTKKKTR